MSTAIQQFLQIIRETWRQVLFCEHCGRETEHTGQTSGRDERYTCAVCQSQKVYTVR